MCICERNSYLTIVLLKKPNAISHYLVRRISARFQYNCAKNGKGLKIGTKEADTTWINNRLGAFGKIKYFGVIPRQLLCI